MKRYNANSIDGTTNDEDRVVAERMISMLGDCESPEVRQLIEQTMDKRLYMMSYRVHNDCK